MKTILNVMLFWGTVSLAQAAQNVVVVLDDSGSMTAMMGNQTRIDAAKNALLTVLQELPEDANVGVLALNGPSGRGEWIIELGPIDKSRLQGEINRIVAQGGTPLGQFMAVAANALLEMRKKQIYGEYRLLVVTDGEANDGPLLEAVLPQIHRRNIIIDVIGVDMKRDHSLATRVDNYRRANDPASLQQAITESLAEVAPSADDAADDAAYEMLAGLSDEAAATIVQALAKVENNPIDPSAILVAPENAPNRPVPPTSPHSPTGRSQKDSSTRVTFVNIFIVLGIAITLAALFLNNLQKRRR